MMMVPPPVTTPSPPALDVIRENDRLRVRTIIQTELHIRGMAIWDVGVASVHRFWLLRILKRADGAHV